MSTLPNQYLDAVAAIGSMSEDGSFIPLASGFFVGRLLSENEKETIHRIYLVSNRHVLKNEDLIAIRVNSLEDKEGKRYLVPRQDESGITRWHFHPDEEIDVAIIDMGGGFFNDEKLDISYFPQETTNLSRQDMIDLGIAEGDFVYTLGFPMGIAGNEKNFTIARSGSIARIRDYYQEFSSTFLIDSFVFPGNSGGPVVFRPTMENLSVKKPVTRAHLLGVVSSYIPYEDIAVSKQTGLERIRFQENSGLAKVFPVQYIDETISDYLEANPD